MIYNYFLNLWNEFLDLKRKKSIEASPMQNNIKFSYYETELRWYNRNVAFNLSDYILQVLAH